MKKNIFLSLILIIFGFGGCGNNDTNNKKEKVPVMKSDNIDIKSSTVSNKTVPARVSDDTDVGKQIDTEPNIVEKVVMMKSDDEGAGKKVDMEPNSVSNKTVLTMESDDEGAGKKVDMEPNSVSNKTVLTMESDDEGAGKKVDIEPN